MTRLHHSIIIVNATPAGLKAGDGADRSPSPDLPGVPLAPPPPGGGLGNTAKSVSHFPSATDAQERRATRFKHQRAAAKLLPNSRTGLCMWAVASLSYGVDVINNTQEGARPLLGLADLRVCLGVPVLFGHGVEATSPRAECAAGLGAETGVAPCDAHIDRPAQRGPPAG